MILTGLIIVHRYLIEYYVLCVNKKKAQDIVVTGHPTGEE